MIIVVKCKKHNLTDLTPKEVSMVFGKNYRTILRWTKAGFFKNAHKCDHCGTYLVPSSDIDEYIESLKV